LARKKRSKVMTTQRSAKVGEKTKGEPPKGKGDRLDRQDAVQKGGQKIFGFYKGGGNKRPK